MGRTRGAYKGPKDFNTEMRLLIARLSRVVVDKQNQVDTLMSERERLLLRAKAAQLVLQTAEAVADLVTALREKGQGEQLKGLAGSQLLAQLQAQLQGFRQELMQLHRSVGAGASSGSVESGSGESSGSGSGAATAGDVSSAGASGAAGGATTDAATPYAFAPWLPPPPPLSWTVEQAIAASYNQHFKGHASLVNAFVLQMAPLLIHINIGAPDEAEARAKLEMLRSGMLARMAAQHLTTAETRLAESIYESYLGPKPLFGGRQWEEEPSPLAPARGCMPAQGMHLGGDDEAASSCSGGSGSTSGTAGAGAAGAGPNGMGDAVPGPAEPTEPPQGHWRWLVGQLQLTTEQEIMFDALMELWWERVTPMWKERAELVSVLQGREQGCCGDSSGGGGGASGGGASGSRASGSSALAGHPLEALENGEQAVSRLEALQSGLFLYQVIFGLAFADGILTSWQLGQGFALSQPFVPSFLVVEQGLRELRAARAASTALGGQGGE